MMLKRAQSSPRSLIALCVFACAFLLRAFFAFQWQYMPYGDVPLLDARAYDDWARALLDGQPNNHAFYQSPVYPYLLALLYRLTGHSFLAASLLNALLDSATAAILSLVSFSLFGRMAAIVTGILAATYAPMIFYTAPLMKESLTLFLFAVFLFAALQILQNNRLRDYALCGLAFGLAALARSNALLLVPLVPLFAALRYRRAALSGIGLFALCAVAAILPATLHNYAATHDFVPITYAGGFNLYIGHSPYANGVNAYPSGISTDPNHESMQTTWIAEHEIGRPLKPSEVSSFWRAKALNFALDNPKQEMRLLGLKFSAFWSGAESYDNYDVGFIKKNFPSLLNLPLASFWLISTLAAFAACGGASRLMPENRQTIFLLLACLFLYMTSVLAFYVTDRYRLPIVIFLMPLAGAAIPCALNLWKQKNGAQFFAAATAALVFFALALHSVPTDVTDYTAADWGTLTTIYADKNDAPHALETFQKGLALSPDAIGAQAYIRAAEMHEKSGDQAAAAQLIETAAARYPDDGVTLYNLGRLQAMTGKMDEAIVTLQRATTLAPTYALTYFALATIYRKQGDNAQAQEALRQGLAVNPDNAQLQALMKDWNAR